MSISVNPQSTPAPSLDYNLNPQTGPDGKPIVLDANGKPQQQDAEGKPIQLGSDGKPVTLGADGQPLDLNKAISDLSLDTSVAMEGETLTLATPHSDTPSLIAPNKTAASLSAFTVPTALPSGPSEAGYSDVMAQFAASGLDGGKAFAAFKSEFPPSSAEYKALLATIFPNFKDPGLSEKVQFMTQFKQEFIPAQIIAQEKELSGASKSTVSTPKKNEPSEGKSTPTENSTQGTLTENPVEGITGRNQSNSSGNQESQESQTPATTTPTSASVQASSTPNVGAAGVPLVNAAATTGVASTTSTTTMSDVDATKAQSKNILDMVDNARVKIESMPDSANKGKMLEYLSKISAAIILFTSMLLALQSTDSVQIREKSHQQLEENLLQVKKQGKALLKQAKANRKEKKKSAKTVMNNIMKGITIALMVVVASVMMLGGPAGVMGGVILMSCAVDMCMKMKPGEKGLFSRASEAADQVISSACKSMGLPDSTIKGLQTAFKILVVVVVCTSMISTGAFMIGGTEAIKGALFDSGLVKNKMAKMVVGMVLDTVAAITAVIVAVVITVVTFGAAAPATGPAIAGAFVQTASMGAKVAQTVQKIMSIVSIALAVVSFANSVSSGTQTIITSVAKMKLFKELGVLQKDIENLKAMVEILKKLIKSLQDMMTGITSTLSEVSNSQNQMWTKLSQSMQQLWAT